MAEALALIIDACAFHEGNCESCEFRELCEVDKPIELIQDK